MEKFVDRRFFLIVVREPLISSHQSKYYVQEYARINPRVLFSEFV